MTENSDQQKGEISMAGSVPTKNGGVGQTTMRPMPQSRRDRVAAGAQAFQELEHEKEELQRLLDESTLRVSALEAELAATQAVGSRQQTEIVNYRRERDNAVAKRAEVEAVFNGALAIMTKYRVPTVAEETEGTDDDSSLSELAHELTRG